LIDASLYRPTHTKVPLRDLEELSFQRIQLLHLDTPDLGIVSVGAEYVALGFAPGAYPSDEETMDSE
jgi:hypothetical protein